VPDQFLFSAALDFHFGPAGVHAGVSGGVARDGFGVKGDGRVTVPGIDAQGLAYVSEKGITACAGIQAGPAGIYGGFGYFWGGRLELWAEDCGMLQFNSAAHFRGVFAAGPGGPVAIEVPKGQRQTLVGARGVSAYPHFTVRSPSGQIVDTSRGEQGPVDAGGYRWVSDPPHNGSYVFVAKPTPGTWTLTAAADSPAIATVGSALSAPTPHVSTTIKRGSRGYRLQWHGPNVGGQVLQFIERGVSTYRSILKTSRPNGSVRFQPNDDGSGGTRHIEVLVSQDGLPRADLTGASFFVAKPPRPARPKLARWRRRHTSVTLTWSASARAARYEVVVKLKDGRRMFFEPTAHRRSITIRHVLAPDSAFATIQPIAADGLKGTKKTAAAKFGT
jgi:hypothetical protein